MKNNPDWAPGSKIPSEGEPGVDSSSGFSWSWLKRKHRDGCNGPHAN